MERRKALVAAGALTATLTAAAAAVAANLGILGVASTKPAAQPVSVVVDPTTSTTGAPVAAPAPQVQIIYENVPGPAAVATGPAPVSVAPVAGPVTTPAPDSAPTAPTAPAVEPTAPPVDDSGHRHGGEPESPEAPDDHPSDDGIPHD